MKKNKYTLCTREVIRDQWRRALRSIRYLSDVQYKVIIPIIFNVVKDFERAIYLDHKIYRRENYAENESYQKTTKCHKPHPRSELNQSIGALDSVEIAGVAEGITIAY